MLARDASRVMPCVGRDHPMYCGPGVVGIRTHTAEDSYRCGARSYFRPNASFSDWQAGASRYCYHAHSAERCEYSKEAG